MWCNVCNEVPLSNLFFIFSLICRYEDSVMSPMLFFIIFTITTSVPLQNIQQWACTTTAPELHHKRECQLYKHHPQRYILSIYNKKFYCLYKNGQGQCTFILIWIRDRESNENALTLGSSSSHCSSAALGSGFITSCWIDPWQNGKERESKRKTETNVGNSCSAVWNKIKLLV